MSPYWKNKRKKFIGIHLSHLSNSGSFQLVWKQRRSRGGKRTKEWQSQIKVRKRKRKKKHLQPLGQYTCMRRLPKAESGIISHCSSLKRIWMQEFLNPCWVLLTDLLVCLIQDWNSQLSILLFGNFVVHEVCVFLHFSPRTLARRIPKLLLADQ